MKFKKLLVVVLTIAMALGLCSCRESWYVKHNVSKEADNFNVTRRLEVINARSDEPLFELIGNFAISNNAENELEVVVELEDGTYKKHYVYLNEYTMYIVEDLSGSDVTPYHYEINVLPQTFQTFELKLGDKVQGH